MIAVQENISLAPLTTFKIGGLADYLCKVISVEDIQEAISFARSKNIPWLVLSGGSNVLVSDEGFHGLVISPEMKGITIVAETDATTTLAVAAGEVWDEVVAYAVERGLWGIENLSHIPGRMGAFAVQNVGAYGQEASEVVLNVIAFDTETGEVVHFKNEACGFYYRHSIFNTTAKNRYIILNTEIILQKIAAPNLSYPDMKKRFAEKPQPALAEIRTAIIEIRNKKYPFPTEAKGGNAGSFFQNPQLTPEQEQILEGAINRNFPTEIQERFKTEKEKFSSRKTGLKVSAFLLDICGLKNTTAGGAYINETQPLVVLNNGTATAKDVLSLAQTVRNAVFERTGIIIPLESELVGFSKEELNDYLFIKSKMV